ncbi:transposase [Schlesneria sp. DSM 10557]|uniref:transposase n=1 Tax=Schlesneria sp. DSM 10557 TaxID=3044399 RepID=UPI0035A1B929
MSRERRKHTPEFKREALNLISSQQLSVAEVSRRLGVSQTLLYKWKAQFAAQGEQAFPGQGQQTAQEAELARLRREVELLRMERDILKKATQFFAKESK